MEIQERIIKKQRQKIISPARSQEVETDEMRERVIIKKNGDRIIETVPVTRIEHIDAVTKTEEYEIKVFVVRDGTEEHEFATEKDAKNFIKDSA